MEGQPRKVCLQTCHRFGKSYVEFVCSEAGSLYQRVFQKEKFETNDLYEKIQDQYFKIRAIKHANLAPYDSITVTDSETILSRKNIIGKNLESVLVESGKFDLPDSIFIFQQINSAVHALHKNSIPEYSLTLNNIIIDSNQVIKLVDYGIEAIAEEHNTSKDDPDALRFFGPYKRKIDSSAAYSWDIWHMGLVFFAICSGQQAFITNNLISLQNMMEKGTLSFTDNTPAVLRPLLSRMLSPNPEVRPDPVEIDTILIKFADVYPRKHSPNSRVLPILIPKPNHPKDEAAKAPALAIRKNRNLCASTAREFQFANVRRRTFSLPI